MLLLRSIFKKHSINPLKINIVANFAGNAWQSLMGLVFIPLYIKYLGIESWGLIGIFATLQVIFGLLDMGLSSTLNREMARLSALPDKEQEMRDLVRTLEIIYWCIAAIVGICVVALSPFIVNHWINIGQLSVKTVEQALLIMGLVMALQMPIGFYGGGLMGLQKQVLLNKINIFMSTLRGAGAVLILKFISPTIGAYFLWQIFISIINVLILGRNLWVTLPVGERKAYFQKKLLVGVGKFAAGMSGITILAVILTQMDKVILSKMLSLEMFGYYTLASTVAMSLTRLTSPVMSAIYPKLTQLISIKDEVGLKELYHKSCQLMSVLIFPFVATLVLFSHEILAMWTQNPTTTENSYLLVSILTCGTGIYGVMVLPYTLQLASGWTSLSIYKNLIAVALLVPLIIFLTNHFGTTGAATVWLILNLGYFFFEIPMVHRRLLRTEKWRWYMSDVCYPLCSSIIIAGLGRILLHGSLPQPLTLLLIICIFFITFIVTAFSTRATRNWIYQSISRIRSK
jgi:O-antigen/teichoic acid export membrane protein